MSVALNKRLNNNKRNNTKCDLLGTWSIMCGGTPKGATTIWSFAVELKEHAHVRSPRHNNNATRIKMKLFIFSPEFSQRIDFV